MYHEPEKPRAPDYDAALGVSGNATPTAIKAAFHKLALKHHPDKQAPGGTANGADFCRVREAYEVLIDAEKRMDYDFQYPNIQDQWQKYSRDHAAWERRAEDEAKAEAERARLQKEYERREWIWTMGKNEDSRRGFQQYEDRMHSTWGCGGNSCEICKQRADRLEYQDGAGIWFPHPEEYIEYLQMKVEEAERVAQAERAARAADVERAAQAQEAAEVEWAEKAERRSQKKWSKGQNKQRKAQERQRAEQEKAARVQKAQSDARAANMRAKEQRSSEAASRARAHQEIAAQISLAKEHVKEQQDIHRSMSDRHRLDKSQGLATCLFCEDLITAFSFRCPDGGAVACLACKEGMCRFTPVNDEDSAEGRYDAEPSETAVAPEDECKESDLKAEETQGAWKPSDEWFRVEVEAEESDDTDMEDSSSDEDEDEGAMG